MIKKVESDKCSAAVGPYSAGIETDEFVYLSGQLGMDSNGNIVSEDVVEQTKASFVNIEALLESLGLTTKNIVKTTVYLTDINNFSDVNVEYAKHFDGTYPARGCFEISKLPKGGKVEIECIAKK